jgi:hypothetical protein
MEPFSSHAERVQPTHCGFAAHGSLVAGSELDDTLQLARFCENLLRTVRCSRQNWGQLLVNSHVVVIVGAAEVCTSWKEMTERREGTDRERTQGKAILERRTEA